MDCLEKLKDFYSVSIDINQHRNYYDTAQTYFNNEFGLLEEGENEPISEEVKKECIKKDYIIRICIYPSNAIGFYVVYHHDINLAIEEILKDINS